MRDENGKRIERYGTTAYSCVLMCMYISLYGVSRLCVRFLTAASEENELKQMLHEKNQAYDVDVRTVLVYVLVYVCTSVVCTGICMYCVCMY